MSDKISELTDEKGNKHIFIDKGNGEFTSMPKEVWDAQQEAAELGGTL